MEWSGVGAQRIVIDWTVIRDEATAKNFSAQITEAPRAFADRTSISGGIDFAMAQFARAPFHANRHTIDVSGDGIHNDGRAVTDGATRRLSDVLIVTRIDRLARNIGDLRDIVRTLKARGAALKAP